MFGGNAENYTLSQERDSNMDSKEIHNLDESAAIIRDHFVPLLKSFYDQCIKEGFTTEQAFALTKEWMHTMKGTGQ